MDIGKNFGFGNIGSLGEGTTRLVLPIFEIAAALVVAYFLVGAFRYLKAESSKEEIEGAKHMITHGIIGFIILMLTFLILQFILAKLFNVESLKIIG